MQENNENVTVKKILGLLKRLSEVQASRALMAAKIFTRETKDQVQSKVEKLKSDMIEKAQIYGQKAKEYAENYENGEIEKQNVISEYEQLLSEVNEEYSAQFKNVLEEKNKLEVLESKLYSKELTLRKQREEKRNSPEYLEYLKKQRDIKEEIDSCYSNEDFDKVSEKIEQAKELKRQNPLIELDDKIQQFEEKIGEVSECIKECNKEIEYIYKSREQKIEEITKDRDTKLVETKPKTLAEKIFGKLFSKFNGINKFKNNVISKISQRIGKIRNEELPLIKENVQNRAISFSNNIEKKSEQIKSNVLEKKDSVVERITETRDMIANRSKQTYNYIITKGKQAKQNILSGIEQRLEREIAKAQEDYVQKQDKLNNKQESQQEESTR